MLGVSSAPSSHVQLGADDSLWRAEGKLMTVFSAPDYPQFQPNNEDRFNNLGAVAVLRGSQGNYASPEMVEYPAAPRPQVSIRQLQQAWDAACCEADNTPKY